MIWMLRRVSWGGFWDGGRDDSALKKRKDFLNDLFPFLSSLPFPLLSSGFSCSFFF